MLENHKPYRGEIADRNAITDCDIALSYLRGSWLYTTQDAAAAVRRVKDYLIEKREEHYEP